MSQFYHRASFIKLWRVAGKPMARIIHPVGTWTMPAGVAYNANQDYFVNAARQRVSVAWDEQPYTEVRIVPGKGRTDIALDVPGQTLISLRDILVLWSAMLETTCKTAWGVSVGGGLYTIRQMTNVPFGAQTPVTIRLSLEERNSAST